MAIKHIPDHRIINKSITSAIFSDYAQFLVTADMMGEAMLSLSIDGEGSTRIPLGIGSVTSPNFYVDCTATIEIAKTSRLATAFFERYKLNNTLTGTMVLNVDNGESFTLNNLSFDIQEFVSNGTTGSISIIFKGNLFVNSDLLF